MGRNEEIRNPKRSKWSPLTVVITIAVAASACGGSPGEADTGDGAGDQVGTAEVAVSSDPVNLEPGAVTEGVVELAGATIDYVVTAPEGFEPGDEAPVLLAFPPGGQDLDLTKRVFAENYADQALDRGWVVVSPAAPGGELYFRGSEELVPGLMDWMTTWVAPESGRFHLAGVSNGGLSAFRAAAGQPDRVASILVYPGFPRGDNDRAALAQLIDVPVRLFVGSEDDGWVEPARDTEARLNDLGGDVELVIYDGVGHFVEPLSGGEILFDELDAARP